MKEGHYWCVKASDAKEFDRLADRVFAAELFNSRYLVVFVATPNDGPPIVYVPGRAERYSVSEFVGLEMITPPEGQGRH